MKYFKIVHCDNCCAKISEEEIKEEEFEKLLHREDVCNSSFASDKCVVEFQNQFCIRCSDDIC